MFIKIYSKKALARQDLDEIDELIQLKNSRSLIDKIKYYIYINLRKYAFITIVLCASVIIILIFLKIIIIFN